MFKSRLFGVWGCMMLLSAGGVVAAALHPEAGAANNVMIGSIVSVAVMTAGSILTCIVQGPQQSGMTSQPAQWDKLLEALQMSENAKRVLFRDRELELFRRTVQEDISRGELHSALVLCDQMASVFGAVEEAEELRSKVQTTIHEQHETRIREELKGLDQLLEEHSWVEAYQRASKLHRLFPESPILHGLEQHIADARTAYANGLEARFLDAAEREDVEQAMSFLRELDGYLTPDAAKRFRDTATVVITTYRESLGERFKMAVRDHRWEQALEFGSEITKQFPNTKMAKEVHAIVDTIRARVEEDETAT